MPLLLRRLVAAVPLLLGVSLISFVLMVGFAPDHTYELLGKSATPLQIAELRHSLGYDQPFWVRYTQFLGEIATLDFGHSDSSGERVTTLLRRSAPVSAAALLPGFVLGHVLALLGALSCARYADGGLDRALSGLTAVGMSLSLVVVVIGAQLLICSVDGLDWLPVRGWDAASLHGYLRHVAVPTLALSFVGATYNLRFYRALLVAELAQPYVQTARAFGASESGILLREVLPNLRMAVITRLLFSVPLLLVSGSLVVENHFGIPGLGATAYHAVTTGDQPVLKALVTLSALLFALALALADGLYRIADPRLDLR